MSHINIPKRFPPPPPKSSPSRTPGTRSRSTSPPPPHLVPRRQSLGDGGAPLSGTQVFATTQPIVEETEEEEPTIIFHSKNSAVFASPPQQLHTNGLTANSNSTQRFVVPPSDRPMMVPHRTDHHSFQGSDEQHNANRRHSHHSVDSHDAGNHHLHGHHHFVFVEEAKHVSVTVERTNPSHNQVLPHTTAPVPSSSAVATAPVESMVSGGPRGGPGRRQANLPDRSPLPTLQPSSYPAAAAALDNDATQALLASTVQQSPSSASSSAPLRRSVVAPSQQLSTASVQSSGGGGVQGLGPMAGAPNVGPQQPLPAPKRLGQSPGAAAAAVTEQSSSPSVPYASQAATNATSSASLATMPQRPISVVLKGAWLSTGDRNSAALLPPSRIVEVSLPRTATVADAIEKCLLVIDADKPGDRNLRIVSAELEQGGLVLPRGAVFEGVSRHAELYFLLVVYKMSQAPPTTSSVVTQASLLPSPSPNLVEQQFSTAEAAHASSLEERLSVLENIVRARSSPRRDEGTGGRHALMLDIGLNTSTDAYSGTQPPVPHRSTSPQKASVPHEVSVPEMSPIQAHAAESSLYGSSGVRDHRQTSPEHREEESYTARAEKLAFVALASKKERLARLEDMKHSIAQRLELYQWMSQRSDPVVDRPHATAGGTFVHQPQPSSNHTRRPIVTPPPPAEVGGIPAAYMQGGGVVDSHAVHSTQHWARLNGGAVSGANGVVDHDNVHVDYDPVLDIWKLRKGPPI